MIARLLICPNIQLIKEEIQKSLVSYIGEGKTIHPDLLYIKSGEKLGIAEARKIKEHFTLKPYSAKGRVVVLEKAEDLTTEAQNALLKTIEELPKEAILILGASSGATILPTILSRCEIINLKDIGDNKPENHDKYSQDLEKLLAAPTSERFEYIEKLKDREEFLHFLTHSFRQTLLTPNSNFTKPEITDFLKSLLQGEEWAKHNVNIRAILEFLMLKMPKIYLNPNP